MLSFRHTYGAGHLLEDHPYITGARVMDAQRRPRAAENDFIILSEFSEQVGPMPVVREYT